MKTTDIKLFSNISNYTGKTIWRTRLKTFLNPLPHTAILGSYNSTANKNMMSKIWTNRVQLSY